MTSFALLIASLATLYAAASWITGFQSDFFIAALVAVLALGVVFLLDHLRYLREVRRQQREAVWRRRLEQGIAARRPRLPNRGDWS